jgi:hypothetical protein
VRRQTGERSHRQEAQEEEARLRQEEEAPQEEEVARSLRVVTGRA